MRTQRECWEALLAGKTLISRVCGYLVKMDPSENIVKKHSNSSASTPWTKASYGFAFPGGWEVYEPEPPRSATYGEAMAAKKVCIHWPNRTSGIYSTDWEEGENTMTQQFNTHQEWMKWCIDHPGEALRDDNGREVWFLGTRFRMSFRPDKGKPGREWKLLDCDLKHIDLPTLQPSNPDLRTSIQEEPPKGPENVDHWRPIETAPKDGSWVQLFIPNVEGIEGYQSVVRWIENGGGFACWYDATWGLIGDDEVDKPTHWRPLPPAPSEEQEKELEPEKPTLGNLAALENWDRFWVTYPSGSMAKFWRDKAWSVDYETVKFVLE